MRTIFLDTVGLLALWDSTDQWHHAATEALSGIEAGARLVTTTFVLLECGNAAARRPYRLLVEAMRKKLEEGGKLIVPSESDWHEGWLAYGQRTIASVGIVDYVSFVVMRRINITEAFTNDRHFKAAGFNTMF